MSLKGDKYETAEEVEFRLRNTVVLYDGDPVYITKTNLPGADDEGEIARVFFQPLPYNGRGREVRKYLSSKKFDLTPFKMGFMNYEGAAYFLARQPLRQNRQGLGAGTLSIKNMSPNETRGIDFNTVITADGFVDMIRGKYPSFQEAGEMLNGGDAYSVAVSRSFCFLFDTDLDMLLLSHRGVKCGTAMKGDKAIRLPEKFHFLRQEAEECRIPLS